MEPGLSLKENILKSDLPSLMKELGEIGIDSLLDEGIVKDFPIINSILSIGKTVGNIRDYFFAKKMMQFLENLSNLSAEERNTLIKKLDNDKDFGKYAGERIIEILDRLEVNIKPVLVATAFKFYARSEIDSPQLQRVINSIERFVLCDIDHLRSFCSASAKHVPTDDSSITANFINSGLGYVASGLGGGGVHPTQTAAVLVRIIDETI